MSDKLLEELENSDILLERQEYATRLKKYIQKLATDIEEYKKLEFTDEAINRNKEILKTWKIKLSNYDVYKQKITCQFCQEIECICYELTRSNQTNGAENVHGIKQGSDTRGETLEKVQGTSGEDSHNTWSQEDLNKLF